MPKFRKRPIVIEAVQWTGSNRDEILAFVGDAGRAIVPLDGVPHSAFVYAIIQTLEGDMTAKHDDWIIRGVKGELYPCKPDIFAATYEPVEE